MLKLSNPPSSNQLSKRQNDGIGFGLEAKEALGLFHEILRKIQCGAHMIEGKFYAFSCQETGRQSSLSGERSGVAAVSAYGHARGL